MIPRSARDLPAGVRESGLARKVSCRFRSTGRDAGRYRKSLYVGVLRYLLYPPAILGFLGKGPGPLGVAPIGIVKVRAVNNLDVGLHDHLRGAPQKGFPESSRSSKKRVPPHFFLF